MSPFDIIHTGAPPSGMTFSPAVMVASDARLVFISGMTAFPIYHPHPLDRSLRAPSDVAEQARLCLQNLQTAIEAANGTLRDIVKVTIFNTQMDQQERVNDVYHEFFREHLPARSHIGVDKLVSDELKIEIEAIAAISGGPRRRRSPHA